MCPDGVAGGAYAPPPKTGAGPSAAELGGPPMPASRSANGSLLGVAGGVPNGAAVAADTKYAGGDAKAGAACVDAGVAAGAENIGGCETATPDALATPPNNAERSASPSIDAGSDSANGCDCGGTGGSAAGGTLLAAGVAWDDGTAAGGGNTTVIPVCCRAIGATSRSAVRLVSGTKFAIDCTLAAGILHAGDASRDRAWACRM